MIDIKNPHAEAHYSLRGKSAVELKLVKIV